jgi:hypothetical protein
MFCVAARCLPGRWAVVLDPGDPRWDRVHDGCAALLAGAVLTAAIGSHPAAGQWAERVRRDVARFRRRYQSVRSAVSGSGSSGSLPRPP